MKILKEDIEKKVINEESLRDGWEEVTDFQDLDVLDDINNLIYELNNCVRGAYTKCRTREALGHYIKDLAERLDYLGDSIISMTDPDDLEESKKVMKEGVEYQYNLEVLPAEIIDQLQEGGYLTGDMDGDCFHSEEEADEAAARINAANIPGLSCWTAEDEEAEGMFEGCYWLQFEYESDNEQDEFDSEYDDQFDWNEEE